MAIPVGLTIVGAVSLGLSGVCSVLGKPTEQFGKKSGELAGKVISDVTKSSSAAQAVVYGGMAGGVIGLSKITETSGKALSILSTLFLAIGAGSLTTALLTLVGSHAAALHGLAVALLAISYRLTSRATP